MRRFTHYWQGVHSLIKLRAKSMPRILKKNCILTSDSICVALHSSSDLLWKLLPEVISNDVADLMVSTVSCSSGSALPSVTPLRTSLFQPAVLRLQQVRTIGFYSEQFDRKDFEFTQIMSRYICKDMCFWTRSDRELEHLDSILTTWQTRRGSTYGGFIRSRTAGIP